MLGLHIALAAWLLGAQFNLPSEPTPIRLDVQLIETPSENAQETARRINQPPKTLAPATPTVVRRAKPVAPPTVLAAAPAAEHAPAQLAVASQQATPAAQAKENPLPAPTSPVVTAARLDAAYLQKAKPVYPNRSRALLEQGEVLLRVNVTAKGEVEHVEIEQSSGYFRLDEAALKAVRTWRFVPARRGEQPIAGRVFVPIPFRLDN